MQSNLQSLNEKILALTSDQIAEVEDFVEFLSVRGRERELTRSAAAVSAPAFEAVWNNPENDAYDAL